MGVSPGAFGQNTSIKLSFQKTHDLEINETSPGTYQILTIGKDPFLFSQPFETALAEGNYILAFDYFSTGHLPDFQIFFAPPVNEKKSFSSELGPREGWSNHSIDLKESMKGWGKKDDYLRLDFGGTPNYRIQLRNIHFRKPTTEELANIANREAKKHEDDIDKIKLKNYLNNIYPYNIRDVSVAENTITINGTAKNRKKKLYLAEIPLYHDVSLLRSYENTWLIPHGKKEFTLTIPRFKPMGDHQSDRVLSKWVIVEKNENSFALQSHARYADIIQSLYDLPEEKPASKKGLGGFSANGYISDLDSLGITSVTINTTITQMMRSKPSDQTISFEYNDRTYYADRKWVESNDRTLQQTAKRNIVVSSVILIEKAVKCLDKEIGRIFEHPDCDPAGIYSMANVTSEEGVEYYAAAIDFLAKRYSRPDKKYGRIHTWIIHNEVDLGWVWTNMGERDTLLYMDTYHKSMRLVYNIARKYNPHAKVFISLTHYWNWTVDKHFYHPKDLLNILLNYSAAEGDFEWAIAYHPYPEDLFEPKSWLDKRVDFTFNTPLITFKNIEVLNAWVKQPATMYLGKYQRSIFLSEQGPNSRDYLAKSLTEQAAGIAYLWKKIELLDGINAFQYHNWIDNRREGGLRIGLRRFTDDEQEPGGKKPIWYVYRDLGTPSENEAVEFAKDIIGIKSWDEVRYRKEIK